jgi:hypothetical protein
MDDDPPPIPMILIDEIKFLKARGINVVISKDGQSLRYWIQDAEVSESELIMQAYLLGMPDSDHLQ